MPGTFDDTQKQRGQIGQHSPIPRRGDARYPKATSYGSIRAVLMLSIEPDLAAAKRALQVLHLLLWREQIQTKTQVLAGT